jgi:hypothetical protein
LRIRAQCNAMQCNACGGVPLTAADAAGRPRATL